MNKETRKLLKRVGAAVRQQRIAQCRTLPNFAIVAGISKGHLSAIERGNVNLCVKTLFKLAAALRVEAWTLCQ